jgi:Mg-chelatase subunit ChlD
MNKTISETKDALLARVGQMHTKGRTALGPAVLTSVAMASKGAPGSQVIICTDGMANVGLGSFQ